MSTQLPPRLARVASRQRGVFSRRQALQAGLTEDAINARVRRKTWRRLYPGVYTTTPGALSRLTRLWAVVLYAGPGAVLSHETAAELHELTEDQSGPVHVSIPKDRKVVPLPGMRIYRVSRYIDPPDAHRDPPHTTLSETLLDLTATAKTFDEVCGWITLAFAHGKVNITQLRYELSTRRMVRWRSRLHDVIGCAAAGDQSVLEYRYTRDVERRHKLPESVRQVPFTTAEGKDGRRDRLYRHFGVVVELDGELAHPPEKTRLDKVRDRAAAAQGLLSVRYLWQDVDGSPCHSAAEVARILKTRGWTGTPRPCSPTCPIRRTLDASPRGS